MDLSISSNQEIAEKVAEHSKEKFRDFNSVAKVVRFMD